MSSSIGRHGIAPIRFHRNLGVSKTFIGHPLGGQRKLSRCQVSPSASNDPDGPDGHTATAFSGFQKYSQTSSAKRATLASQRVDLKVTKSPSATSPQFVTCRVCGSC